jgi:hypothetical protein
MVALQQRADGDKTLDTRRDATVRERCGPHGEATKCSGGVRFCRFDDMNGQAAGSLEIKHGFWIDGREGCLQVMILLCSVLHRNRQGL